MEAPCDEVYVRFQGDEVVLSTRPKAPMQGLVDALSDFEAGFRMQREQPARFDERAPLAPRRRLR